MPGLSAKDLKDFKDLKVGRTGESPSHLIEFPLSFSENVPGH